MPATARPRPASAWEMSRRWCPRITNRRFVTGVTESQPASCNSGDGRSGMIRRTIMRSRTMNVQSSEVRELQADEIDLIAGGVNP